MGSRAEGVGCIPQRRKWRPVPRVQGSSPSCRSLLRGLPRFGLGFPSWIRALDLCCGWTSFPHPPPHGCDSPLIITLCGRGSAWVGASD